MVKPHRTPPNAKLESCPMNAAPFPPIRFQGTLRPSQADVVKIARGKLAGGARRLHIVAPPGSGKTVLGLYLWAECVCRPALVLSPNSAIQAQWAARTGMFRAGESGLDGQVSTSADTPKLLTSLTYQSVTLPRRGGEDLDAEAHQLWQSRLIEKGQAKDPDEAAVWIDDLRRHNAEYYERRLSAYRKEIRDAAAMGGQSLRMLHDSSRATLQRLREANVGMIILDECHHLMGHWGRVLADARELLDDPVIVGLTATPPDRGGKANEDIQRYDEFFGPVDYEVPVPAVVKDGFLAPYQDLAYFVRPTPEELAFIASADERLHALVDRLCQTREGAAPKTEPAVVVDSPLPGDPSAAIPAPAAASKFQAGDPSSTPLPLGEDGSRSEPGEGSSAPPNNSTEPHSGDPSGVAPLELPAADQMQPLPENGEAEDDVEPPADYICEEPLPDWLLRVLTERRLPTGLQKDWSTFARRDHEVTRATRLFILTRGRPPPDTVRTPKWEDGGEEIPEMAILVPVLDRYIRHRLRRSAEPADHALARRAIAQLRLLGVQITETGAQACASPVGRVLAYSRSKAAALGPILSAEMETLGEKLRAVVVADFEKSSVVSAEVNHLLDEEAGGAIAAFKTIIRAPNLETIDPVLVTGSSVLVDDDLAERFLEAARAWLTQRSYQVELKLERQDGFAVVAGSGQDWCPRVYVELITDLFQQGVTRCLVGTRGLLGEGWDASKINVLIDLTTVTTSMSVNQLRGRSIRLDSDDPAKLADNWDVVCLAPEFSKGLDDYARFIAKHKTLFGVTDDGAVEKGVGHVHAAFTELRPEGLEGNMGVLNADMLARVRRRPECRELWRIGQTYHDEAVRAVGPGRSAAAVMRAAAFRRSQPRRSRGGPIRSPRPSARRCWKGCAKPSCSPRGGRCTWARGPAVTCGCFWNRPPRKNRSSSPRR